MGENYYYENEVRIRLKCGSVGILSYFNAYA